MRITLVVLLVLLSAARAAAAQPQRTWRTMAGWYVHMFDPEEMQMFAPKAEQSELRYKLGDDPGWAAPGFDDAGWSVVDRAKALRKGSGIFWIRFRTRSNESGQSLPTGFFLGETAASEMFWDGVLIRRFGQPGPDRAHEIAGPVYTFFDLPAAAVGPGEHVMALRMSTYRFNRPDPTMDLYVGNVIMGQVEHVMVRQMLIPMLGVGALAFFGLGALVLWFTTGRPRGVLLFAGLCLGGAITHFSIHIRHLFAVPYSWSYPLWTGTEILVALTAACLVALVLVQFNLPRRGWVLAAFLALEAADGIRQALVYHMMEPIKGMIDSWRAAFFASIILLIWALIRRRRGAGYVLLAAILATGWYEHDPEEFLSDTFLLTILPLLLGFIVVIGLELSAERRQAAEARQTAARLELELLRKSLQPHFLMNTLTALAQAMEESPPSATKLIDDLGGELRELAQFAEHREVPLHRELDLCRAHLRVMSVRTEKPWRLEVEGTDPEAMVPPALFFTLIENGFTHQQPVGGATAFRLRGEPTADGQRYVFFSPGKVRSPPGRASGGSGLRYVKARLNEGWTAGWSFDHGPVEAGWETRVELGRRKERRDP